MEKHINIIAALHIGLSIFGIFIGIALFFLLNLLGDTTQDQQAQVVFSMLSRGLSIFLVVMSIPGLIAGIGLFKRKEWARILALIISIISLLNFPIGTAVGVYSIWALVNPEVIDNFKDKERGVTI